MVQATNLVAFLVGQAIAETTTIAIHLLEVGRIVTARGLNAQDKP
ncbi:hypothetical protein [Microbaculum marinum]|uniref:Uncharacterized protein n=1 Tax=Microbaculum marinum TaxID=1764581 RepID=A0AAW9RP98_9HYPH